MNKYFCANKKDTLYFIFAVDKKYIYSLSVLFELDFEGYFSITFGSVNV